MEGGTPGVGRILMSVLIRSSLVLQTLGAVCVISHVTTIFR